jgi:hypothetical protein
MYDPNPQWRVKVCFDGWESFSPVAELDLLPVDAVALIEIYGGGLGPPQIRVYTPGWMLLRARTGRTNVLPLGMGCG